MKSWWFNNLFLFLVNWPCLVQQPINPCANVYTILYQPWQTKTGLTYTNTQTYTDMFSQSALTLNNAAFFLPPFLHCIFSSFISSLVSFRSSFLIPSFVLPISHHSWAAAFGGGQSPVKYWVNLYIHTSISTFHKGPHSLLFAQFLCIARSVKNFLKQLLCTVGSR